MKSIVASLGACAVLSFTGLAAAQINQHAPNGARAAATPEPVVSAAQGPTYTVTFRDDPLAAALEDGNLPRIQVRATKAFGQLSRPRLQFVTEMLKSVEVM